MGNNTSRDTQWSEAPKRPDGPLCGAVRPEPRFPSLPPILCNRELAHAGEMSEKPRKIPKELSRGECAFALHCRAEKIYPIREWRFHPERKWRFDFAFPKAKLAVEIEGGVWSAGRHTRGSGFEGDCAKYAEAAILGWRVIRCSTEQVLSGQAIDWVLRAMNARV